MLDLIILSDNPITYESCSKLIKESFGGLVVCGDDHESILMKKSRKGFEIWFSPNDVLSNPECYMGDTVEKCPNKNAYLTNLSYTSKYYASKIVELLLPLYGNMWIQIDEEDEWFGTAQDFINIYCH